MVMYRDWYKIIYDSHPRLTFCEWFDETDNLWNYNRHSHPYIELIYFINGYSSLEVEGTRFPFSIYDALLIPSFCEHKDALVSEIKREIICLWVDIPQLVLPSVVVLKENKGQFHRLFLDIFNEQKSRFSNPMVLEYQLKLLLTTIIREHYELEDKDKSLEKVMTYIAYHYTEHITVGQLAEMEYVSKSYLSRKFKQKTGRSVVEYINDLRISKAKALLVGTDKSVTDIAYEVGFESPKYFHRVFRSLVEMTPAGYRKAYKTEK